MICQATWTTLYAPVWLNTTNRTCRALLPIRAGLYKQFTETRTHTHIMDKSTELSRRCEHFFQLKHIEPELNPREHTTFIKSTIIPATSQQLSKWSKFLPNQDLGISPSPAPRSYESLSWFGLGAGRGRGLHGLLHLLPVVRTIAIRHGGNSNGRY